VKITGHVVGHLTAPAGLWREGESPLSMRRIPVPAYTVEHPEGLVLIDTGLHPGDPVERYGSLARMFGWDNTWSIDRALGPALDDVRFVVLSHLHFDHAGGLDLVPRHATVVLPKADLEADAADNNFRAIDYETGHARVEIEGVYDLFGDGAIVLHPTPGHTPGHHSVVVDGDVLIAADACYFPENVDSERFPAYGWDRDKERESLDWIREQRDSGLTVLYGHEPSAGTFQRP
jgi:N-acyl homoserine lactone hydrolase